MSKSTATRNITFRLYPTPKQKSILEEWLGLHRELYNAALQERRDAYQKCGISLSYNDQQNQLPGVKEARPELTFLGSHALQETVRRVDRAFRAFFRRLRNGENPGFPRFKGKTRFHSFTYPDPAGWKILEQKNRKGKLRITNLGTIRMRGKPRVALANGEPRTLTIRRRNDKWYATVGVRYPKEKVSRNRAYSNRSVGIDVGAHSLVATSDGDLLANPKPLSGALERLKKTQRELSRKKKFSRNWNKAKRKLARLHEKVRNRRLDTLHQLSSVLTFIYSFIAIENLSLRNMTRSARGTKEKPGKRVKQRARLNRSMLDASIGLFFSMLEYKAEEAGIRLEKVPANGTSQRCSRCGECVPKDLSVRIHRCPKCGLVLDRDINAARNILFLGLAQAGREPSEVWRGRVASPLKHETASMLPVAA